MSVRPGRCSKQGCTSPGIYHAWVELWPLFGGEPAQLFFPTLIYCEEHANALTWQDLVHPPSIEQIFRGLGRPVPDFPKTQVKLAVVTGEETV